MNFVAKTGSNQSACGTSVRGEKFNLENSSTHRKVSSSQCSSSSSRAIATCSWPRGRRTDRRRFTPYSFITNQPTFEQDNSFFVFFFFTTKILSTHFGNGQQMRDPPSFLSDPIKRPSPPLVVWPRASLINMRFWFFFFFTFSLKVANLHKLCVKFDSDTVRCAVAGGGGEESFSSPRFQRQNTATYTHWHDNERRKIYIKKKKEIRREKAAPPCLKNASGRLTSAAGCIGRLIGGGWRMKAARRKQGENRRRIEGE